ncbi:hypothetical protein [Sporisorium scitamineum]|uniref:Uncharacterized protein n=1 Tax=Sporisorium scitamineum TaxID=49012 RepID=A0A0F7SC10_9BASI|nr:hypothetical protein [Sporisorium scitamineum]
MDITESQLSPAVKFDPLKYVSQVYEKVNALSSVKQLLFEVGLCEISSSSPR